MKKLLSVVLTVAMLASIVSAPATVGAAAYTEVNVSSGFAADNSFVNNCTEAAVYGIAGKDAADESVAIKEHANTWTSWYDYNHGEEIYFENGKPLEGYLVAELNFMAPEAAYLEEFIFGLSNNQARMTVNPTKNLKANIGKWNHLRMVYWADETNCDFIDFANNVPNVDAKLGSTTLYLNGEELGTKNITCTASQFSNPIENILFEIYSKDKTVQHITYFDDIKIYKSAVNPGAQIKSSIAAAEGYTVANGVITLSSDAVTVADVAAANPDYEIAVFTDAGFGTALAAEDTLSLGNCVVSKSSDGVYTYYNVEDIYTKILFEENDGTFENEWCKKMTQQSVSGVGGKALTDESVLFTTDLSTFDGNMMLNKDNYYTKTKKYFVIEANINPVNGEYYMPSMSVNTNSHAVVGDYIGLQLDKWNKYFMYVDFTTETPTSYTYVNGELVKTRDVPETFGNKSTVRMCFNGDKANPKEYQVYVDDFRIYETDIEPDGVAGTTLSVPAGSANYSVVKGKLNVLPEVTVAQLKAANEGARVFTDATCTAYAADSAVAENGMVFALEGANKAVSAYPVVISYGEVEIDLRTGDNNAAFPTVANGSGEVVAGFAGKAASDKVLAITANTDTYIALKSWGTVVKTGSDNSVTPSWSKSDYNGYLVVEASMFNIDNTTISLVTTQTGQVSGNIAAIIPESQWARVKFIYNAKDGDANEGKTIAYVNGIAVTGWVNSTFGTMAAYTTNNYMRNDIRISIKGSISGKPATYIDDIRVYEIPALRAEESLAFNAPEGAYVIGDTFSHVDGAQISAEQIKNANPGSDVKVFRSVSDYTEIADSDYIADGNIVFISGRSQSTTDAGFDYNDLFCVLTVGKVDSTKNVITSVPASAVRGAISDVNVAYENTSSVKMITDTSTSDSNWYFAHGYRGITEGMKYLVFEIDFAPSEEVKDIYFAANQHAQLSSMVKVGNQLVANRWSKIVMVYDVAADTSDLYINGTMVSEGFAGSYGTKMEANNNAIEFRVVVDCKMGAVSYVDTYRLYESALYPEIAQPARLADGYENRILANYAASTADINEAVTVAEVASNIAGGTAYAFEDGTYGSLLDSTDTFSAGNVLVLKTDENLFTTYNVTTHKSDNIIASGDTYDGAGNMTTGTIGLYAPVSKGGMLIAAQYDEEGNVLKVAVDNTAENNTLEIIFETEEIDKTKVKAFLFESANSLKPLCKELEIGVRDYINVLLLGNSYSMDVTWHLRQIAAADDVLMNVHVLNKGGCHLRYHYDNREGNAAELGINFWENNKSLGTIYNLEQVLEKYDWDYVTIQASSTSKGLDDTSEENYQANWAVAVPFAQYIHEKEPDARITIHSTWSMESGYNFVTDSETRDTIMANMKALNNRCADEINSTLGLEGDDKVLVIYSTDVINAARSYAPAQDITINGRTCAAGTKLFDTTYYKDGHVFTFTEANVRDVEVGDGSMLLSDSDRAAGKISLHRDGFHMSALGRYLIALNAYATLTGNKVTGNTFDSFDATRSDGRIRLDSSPGGLHVTETDTNTSQTVFQIYDILTPEVRSICQEIVDSLR